MNRFESLRVFAVAAEAVNFRDAAARLGVSPQVVTRAVRELEDELGEPLFHRSTRGVNLSSFGEQWALRARQAVGGVDELFHRADRRAPSEHAGVVRVAAPSGIGRQFILKALAPLLQQHPGLVLDLRLSEALAHVVDEQIDVGVRIGFLRDSRFVARPASKVSFVIAGTPTLLKRTGAPADVAALFERPLTTLIDRNSGRAWPWVFRGGRQLAPPSPAFVTDDPEAECAAVLEGIGFGQLPAYLAQPLLRTGRLVTLLDHEAPEPWSLYVYRAQRTPVPARVRLVFDCLLEALGEGEGSLLAAASAAGTVRRSPRAR